MYLVPFVPRDYRHAGVPASPNGRVKAVVPANVRVTLIGRDGTRYELRQVSFSEASDAQWQRASEQWGVQRGHTDLLEVDVPPGVYTATASYVDAVGNQCINRNLQWETYSPATASRSLTTTGTVYAAGVVQIAPEEYRSLLTEQTMCGSRDAADTLTDARRSTALAVGVGVVSAAGLLYLISKKG